MDLSRLPKAELHSHLEGLLDVKMASTICRQYPDFPITSDELGNLSPVNDYPSFVRWLSYVEQLKSEFSWYFPILQEHIQRLKKQNVLYSEIMLSSGLLPWDKKTVVMQIRDLRNWVDYLEQGEIQIDFLLAFGRNRTLSEIVDILGIITSLREADLVVGVALAGSEPGRPLEQLEFIFRKCREMGLGIEIHAGETCGSKLIWDAITYGYPNRLGHGIALFSDKNLLSEIKARGIHVELCPTSNYRTQSVHTIGHHPIKIANRMKMNFSVNTDDPGPFQCSMLSEYELLFEIFGFDHNDFINIFENSINSRFQPQLRHKNLIHFLH